MGPAYHQSRTNQDRYFPKNIHEKPRKSAKSRSRVEIFLEIFFAKDMFETVISGRIGVEVFYIFYAITKICYNYKPRRPGLWTHQFKESKKRKFCEPPSKVGPYGSL